MSELNIQKRQSGGVTLLDLSGRITIADGSTVLRQAVRSSLEEGQRRIVLNLANVTTLDSSGLGELVSSYTTTSQQGGKLKLLNPTLKIQDLLMITKLIAVFETFENEQEAVNSFH